MSAALKADQLSQLAGRVGAVFGVLSLATYRKIIIAVCIIFLLLLSTDIFWMLMPTPKAHSIGAGVQFSSNTQSNANAAGGNTAQDSYVDLATMQSWYLFGEANAVNDNAAQVEAASEVDDDAPETNLSLTLQGLVASSDPELSKAVIEYAGETDLYKVGQGLPVGRGISVAKILPDRVIIDNRGQNEALFLYDEKGDRIGAVKKPQNNSRAKVIDRRGDKAISKLASEYKEKLLSNPSSVANVLRIAPVNDANGNIRGYRLGAGSKPKQFAQLGLKNGDVVTSVNGIALDDPSNTLKLYQELRNLSEASIDIQRGGQNISLIIGLSN